MKKNDLIYAETNEYLKGVGAAPEVVSDYREVRKEKWQDAMTIIGTITATCNNAFYGATITPRNQADATVRCRVGHVAAIDLDAIFELTTKITVTPIDSTFVIEAIIEDFYSDYSNG